MKDKFVANEIIEYIRSGIKYKKEEEIHIKKYTQGKIIINEEDKTRPTDEMTENY